MKNIHLKFLGLGYNSSFQAFVRIYDLEDNLIYEGMTYNNILSINLNMCNCYKIVASFLSETLIKYICIGSMDTYIFIFDHAIFNDDNSITFLLTDYYYNLPIERGELILWQR